jgi:glutamate-1-semialdehyde 2,1-aminomutase
VQEGWRDCAARNSVSVEIGGIFPLSHFAFMHEKPLLLKTLFTQLMLERGFLASTGVYASYAHKEEHLEHYLKGVDEVFRLMSQWIEQGTVEKHLKGPICHSGFKRLT